LTDEMRAHPGPRAGDPARSTASWPVVSLVLAASLVAGLEASVAEARPPVVVAAGDIACAGHPCMTQRRTARLIGRIDPQAVLTLGDNQYESGRLEDYRSSYAPTWGRFKARTHPAPGNHDYNTPGAAGYFAYFGKRAHRRSGGNYGFDLGRWHVLSINSGPGHISDRQLRWARSDLRKDHHPCELAYWHHPRWSSGSHHGSDDAMARLWALLFRQGVDVVLSGHDHEYERFAKLNADGHPAPHGVREFVVGTGGKSLYGFTPSPIEGSQRRILRFGVLRLVLRPRSYRWRFVATGGGVLDRGATDCHG
jgi:3',5'-cyclic AMP phosphodiesterase CpdA